MVCLYLPLADEASIYDNSDGALTLIAERFGGSKLIVNDKERWAKIEGVAK
jgi:predicted ABC-type ATPase